MKVISAKDYATLIGVSVSYITKVLKKSNTLPLTTSVEKYGNTWRICIDEFFNPSEAKNLLKTLLK